MIGLVIAALVLGLVCGWLVAKDYYVKKYEARITLMEKRIESLSRDGIRVGPVKWG